MTQARQAELPSGDPVVFARRFMASRFPEALAAFLSGSRARGEAKADSDWDVIVLLPSVPAAWREATSFEGAAIELFVHDPATLAYFCRETDRRSGMPVIAAGVAEGLPVIGEGTAPFERARALASAALAAGPAPLDPSAIAARRNAVTGLVETLESRRERHVQIAAGATLYPLLADFALRAAGRWSAAGKSLPRALLKADPELAVRFEAAFEALFGSGAPDAAVTLADDLLAPHGGRLREGFRIGSPPQWRDR